MDTIWFEQQKQASGVGNAALAESIGRDVSLVSKLLRGKTRFDPLFVEPFAKTLKVDTAEIARRAGLSVLTDLASNAAPVAFEGAPLDNPAENLPVYGTAFGATSRQIDGEAIEQTTLNTGDTLEYVKRPAILKGKRQAYGLHVQGSSMHPALPDGEMVVACRDMPLAVGDNVVVYMRNVEHDDGETARSVLVKELVRRSATYVELRQYDPRMDFRLPMDEVLRIDRILTRREMLS
jgi:hypothetical protein